MYDDDDEDDDNDREALVTCRGDQGEDQFPGESEEVHDVVSARGHLLLALLAFLAFFVVIWIKQESDRAAVECGNLSDQLTSFGIQGFNLQLLGIYSWMESIWNTAMFTSAQNTI